MTWKVSLRIGMADPTGRSEMVCNAPCPTTFPVHPVCTLPPRHKGYDGWPHIAGDGSEIIHIWPVDEASPL